MPVRRAARIAFAVVLVAAVAGCGGQPPSRPSDALPSATSAPPPTASPGAAASPAATEGPLLTVGYRGGHCRTGPCDRTVAIDADGTVQVTAPEPVALGTMPAPLFQKIQEQLSVADFEALGSRPFTGECPVNFDGQELIYTFFGATGAIRLASCEVEIDPTHPLFAAIEEGLAAVPMP